MQINDAIETARKITSPEFMHNNLSAATEIGLVVQAMVRLAETQQFHLLKGARETMERWATYPPSTTAKSFQSDVSESREKWMRCFDELAVVAPDLIPTFLSVTREEIACVMFQRQAVTQPARTHNEPLRLSFATRERHHD